MNARFFSVQRVMVALLILDVGISQAWCQERDMQTMDGSSVNHHGGMPSPDDEGFPKSTPARSMDSRVSEFNHHVAGFILFLASIFLFAEDFLSISWSTGKYFPPMCFLVAGIFVLLFSDKEIWPLGSQTPWYALGHSLEDVQHKGFALILLVLGYVEFQRAKGRFTGILSVLCFPLLAFAGAILLLLHVHGGDMSAPDSMRVMARIETQHRWFAATGLGIAVTKGLAEIPNNWHQLLKRVWPALLCLLGILLMTYTERAH